MADDQPGLKISSREELEAFLKDRPRKDAVAIARRASWRAMPFISHEIDDALFQRLTLASFRATITAQHGLSAAAAATAAYAAATAAYDAAAADAAYAAANAAIAAYDDANAATNAAYAATNADAATNATYADAAAAIWQEVESDCRALQTGETDLLSQPLWAETPAWFDVETADWRISLKELGGAWPLIETWFEQVKTDGTVDPFQISGLDEIADQTPWFWGDGKKDGKPAYWGEGPDNPRTPDIVIADIAERLGWNVKMTPDPDSEDADTFEQRPAPHRYSVVDGKVHTVAATPLLDDPIREAMHSEVKRKAEDARNACSGNSGDPRLEATLDRLLDVLGGSDRDVNPGLLLMSARSVQADVSEFDTPELRDRLVEGAIAKLRDVQASIDDLLGTYPEVQDILANSLALNIQTSDVVQINELDKDIEQVALASDHVSDSAKKALRESREEIDSRIEKMQSAFSETKIAQYSKEAAKALSVKLLSTRNFIAASAASAKSGLGTAAGKTGKAVSDFVKDAGNATRKGTISGIEKGVESSVKGAVVGGVTILVGKLAGPLLALGVLVGSFAPLGKKAEEVKDAAVEDYESESDHKSD